MYAGLLLQHLTNAVVVISVRQCAALLLLLMLLLLLLLLLCEDGARTIGQSQMLHRVDRCQGHSAVHKISWRHAGQYITRL